MQHQGFPDASVCKMQSGCTLQHTGSTSHHECARLVPSRAGIQNSSCSSLASSQIDSSNGNYLRPPCAASWALAAWAAARSLSTWRSFSFSLASLPLPCTAAGATGSCACGSDTPACQMSQTESSQSFSLYSFTLLSYATGGSHCCACKQHAGGNSQGGHSHLYDCANPALSIPLFYNCATAPSED